MIDEPWLLIPACAVLGLLIGSFLNVVVYRLPIMLKRNCAVDASDYLLEEEVQASIALGTDERKEVNAAVATVKKALTALPPFSLSKPRSRCPSCGHPISALENIPVVSYLALRGRCKACNARISPRYPIVEALTGLLFGAAAFTFGFTPALPVALFMIAMLVSLTLIDADTMLLPDVMTLSMLWLGLLTSALHYGFVPLADSVAGAALGYAAFWLIATLFRVLRGVEGMGAGDFKLLAALGAWFGWTALLPIVLLSAGVGSVVGITLMVSGRATMLSRLPFGVYLAPAGILMLFYGRELTALVLPGGS
jgi:leader peptidase (prepilin peptidase) / N-methyltransferase